MGERKKGYERGDDCYVEKVWRINSVLANKEKEAPKKY